jgi:hypothetical protein
MAPTLTDEVWTALGDRSFAPGRQQPAETPSSGLPIPIDELSPYRIPYFSHHGGMTLEYLENDARAVVNARLSSDLQALRRLSPFIHRLVVDFIEVIAIRREIEETPGFHSGTFDRYVGLVLLTNADLAGADTVRIVDAIVHEMIHCLIFNYENGMTRFVFEPTDEVRVESTWSGASLPLPSFVQACIVWYSLYWLWERALVERDAAFERERCLSFQRRAYAGFQRRPVSERLFPLRHLISEEVYRLLSALEERMRSL